MTQLADFGQQGGGVESVGRAFAPFLTRALAQLRPKR
jgi:hypothetical protein